RVDIDIHSIRRDPDEQVHFRAAFLDRGDAVGLGNRVRNGSILDDPPVDEDVLNAADGALVTENGHVTVNLKSGCLLAHFDEIQALPEELKEAVPETLRRRTLEHLSARLPGPCRRAAHQRKTNLRVPERHLRDETGNLGRLRGVGLEELAAGGQTLEKIVDLDGRVPGRPNLAL